MMGPSAEKDALVWECGPHANAWSGHDARCRQVPAPTVTPADADDAERGVAELARVLAEIDSDAWASTFLEEWCRPYFGDDQADAVAAVQRAMKATFTRDLPPDVSATPLAPLTTNETREDT